MTSLQILIVAILIDYFVGDPPQLWRKYPHPAVIMGWVVNFLDQQLNRGGMRMVLGIVVAILLVLLGLAVGLLIRNLPDFNFGPITLFYDVIEICIVSVLLAHNSLIKHVEAVTDGLGQSLEAGRQNVSYIVGRNTAHMDTSDVSRAAVESAAENFSDGVVAPIFWFILLGLPGILIYKFVNTADSMIGHQTERYAQFGYGVAKLDDIMNFIPARLTGGLFCLIYRSKDAFEVMMSDADLHRSLNAGWPEAAMASILGVALSGPRSYDGQTMSQDSFLNPRGRQNMNAEDITASVIVLNRSWIAILGFLLLLAILIWLF
ncbi:MAG: adenosylcobinamide-phosphate synthase CbiB [Pseudomonadota bacterium]